MALTRKLLKGMGLTEEQVDTIIEAHSETVEGLKKQAETYKSDAEKLPDAQRELEELKKKGDDGYKKMYEDEHSAHEKLKADIAKKESAAAREKALRAYYESKGITGDNLAIAMMGSGQVIEGLEMDGESIKDTTALDALVKGTFSKLVTTTTVKGAETPNPPAGNPSKTYTSDDIRKMSPAQINQNWAAIKASLDTRGE